MRQGPVGRITEIELYYTTIVDENGEEYSGTPTTITPIEDYEKAVMNGTISPFWM